MFGFQGKQLSFYTELNFKPWRVIEQLQKHSSTKRVHLRHDLVHLRALELQTKKQTESGVVLITTDMYGVGMWAYLLMQIKSLFSVVAGLFSLLLSIRCVLAKSDHPYFN